MAVFRVDLSLGWFWEDNIYYITLHSLRLFHSLSGFSLLVILTILGRHDSG